MPSRLALVLGAALVAALGCMSRPTAPTGDDAAGAGAGGEYVMWRHNGAAPVTTWVEAGGGVVHTRADLALPGGGTLWTWHARPTPIKVLDCACYDPFDLPASEAGRAEQRARCTRDASIDALVLHDEASGAEVPLLADVPDDAGVDPALFEGTLARTFTPLGGVGNWLFLTRKDVVYTCGAPKPVERFTFEVIDLDKQAHSTIFSPAELARIEAEERVEAATALCVAPDCFQPKPDATRLTRSWPAFGEGGALVLKLQFTTDAALNASDGRWDSGTRSVVLDAKALPAALAPFATPPGPVKELWTLGGVPEVGGFAPVDPALRKPFGG